MIGRRRLIDIGTKVGGDLSTAYRAKAARRATQQRSTMNTATGIARRSMQYGKAGRTARNAGRAAGKRPVMTAMAAGAAVTVGASAYGSLPGANRSKRNQNSRVLRNIRKHQTDALSGLQPFVPTSGSIRPKSSGGFTL